MNLRTVNAVGEDERFRIALFFRATAQSNKQEKEPATRASAHAKWIQKQRPACHLRLPSSNRRRRSLGNHPGRTSQRVLPADGVIPHKPVDVDAAGEADGSS